MTRTSLFFSLSIVALAASSALSTACSSGDIAVGASSQQLKKTPSGGPTGNGTKCSWDDTVSNDATTGTTTTTPSASGQYAIGDQFKAPDGCNDCSCSAQGISCTLLACDSPPACSTEAKQCPDGSYVGRSGPACEFTACPTGVACTEEAKQCPDGSYVSRTGPSCEFAPCPTAPPTACTTDAKQCPDGSYVSRTGPNCEFAKCP